MNRFLLAELDAALANAGVKRAFVPAGVQTDPQSAAVMQQAGAMGSPAPAIQPAPAVDPAAGGALGQGGSGTPMADPNAQGAPPPDPSAQGAPPAAPPPADPTAAGVVTPDSVRQIFREEMANHAAQGGAQGKGGKGQGAKKIDPAEILHALHRQEKLLLHVMGSMGQDIPATEVANMLHPPDPEQDGGQGGAGGASGGGAEQPKPQAKAAAAQPSLAERLQAVQYLAEAAVNSARMRKLAEALTP